MDPTKPNKHFRSFSFREHGLGLVCLLQNVGLVINPTSFMSLCFGFLHFVSPTSIEIEVKSCTRVRLLIIRIVPCDFVKIANRSTSVTTFLNSSPTDCHPSSSATTKQRLRINFVILLCYSVSF